MKDPTSRSEPLRSQRRWNDNLLNHLFLEEVCNHIIYNVGCGEDTDEWDKLWWMAHSSGKFNVNSAWEILKNASNRKNSSSVGKTEFLKLPIGEFLIRIALVDDVKWCCCKTLAKESNEHLFITCPVVTTLRKNFAAAAAGLRGPFPHPKDTMFKWWNATCSVKRRRLFKAVPTFNNVANLEEEEKDKAWW
ncbi:hypothetical protein H5410_003013 [Solanum commersonii]|uniref:Reverse transcriptase zinc-binding domain-containing protein n=1 Tax=Solanum commersonii TaxID=4109 RepID=A0A9J6B3U7_SOLCO|nr:hypothetical protein H5410_003013 [Solanum commersonii]